MTPEVNALTTALQQGSPELMEAIEKIEALEMVEAIKESEALQPDNVAEGPPGTPHQENPGGWRPDIVMPPPPPPREPPTTTKWQSAPSVAVVAVAEQRPAGKGDRHGQPGGWRSWGP